MTNYIKPKAKKVAKLPNTKRAKNPLAQRHLQFNLRARGIFLKLYEETAQLHLAAEGAGVPVSVVKRYLKEDEEFATLYTEATERFRDKLEVEAWRRAVEGTEEPVYQQGALVGSKQRFSDTLLLALLKRHRTAEYRDQGTLDVNLKGGVLVTPGTALTPEEWAERNKPL